MKKMTHPLITILSSGALLFYALPLLGSKVASTASLFFYIAMLFLVNPAYSFASGLLYGAKFGVKWYLPVVVAALFAPSIFVFYNSSAWVYSVAYFTLSLMGCFVGNGYRYKGTSRRLVFKNAQEENDEIS